MIKYDSASKMFGRVFFCVLCGGGCSVLAYGRVVVSRYSWLFGRSMASHFRIVLAVIITFISSLTAALDIINPEF